MSGQQKTRGAHIQAPMIHKKAEEIHVIAPVSCINAAQSLHIIMSTTGKPLQGRESLQREMHSTQRHHDNTD